jgi:PLP dependent protein
MMLDSAVLEANYKHAKAHIEEVCRACGRDPEEVTLVAVSKTVDADTVGAAIACGMRVFGENRAQDFRVKQERYPQADWHFIGRIQTNKLKYVVGKATLIHSVASIHALAAVDRQADASDVVQDILLEVNAVGEESKDGFAPSELDAALQEAAGYQHICVRGLMTMAPHGDSMRARMAFGRLRALREKFRPLYSDAGNICLSELSMGMSEDHGIALEEGATIVRLGRTIFGFPPEAKD